MERVFTPPHCKDQDRIALCAISYSGATRRAAFDAAWGMFIDDCDDDDRVRLMDAAHLGARKGVRGLEAWEVHHRCGTQMHREAYPQM